MKVSVHLGLAPRRGIGWRTRKDQEQRQLLGPERLDGSALGRGVDAQASGLGAPGLGPGPAFGQYSMKPSLNLGAVFWATITIGFVLSGMRTGSTAHRNSPKRLRTPRSPPRGLEKGRSHELMTAGTGG
jgi:hypothetical protein